MTENFDKFLTECLSQTEKVFVAESDPVSLSEIEVAENSLGIKLPDSYRHFLRRCGSGTWYNECISHPTNLYDFDTDCLDMEGFIALVQNVRGVGDFIAFNPKDLEVSGVRCCRSRAIRGQPKHYRFHLLAILQLCSLGQRRPSYHSVVAGVRDGRRRGYLRYCRAARENKARRLPARRIDRTRPPSLFIFSGSR